MTKPRFLTLAVAALLLLNIATLAFFLLGKKPPHRGDGPRKMVIERLHFDKKQADDYETLIKKHQADIRQKEEEMAAAKQVLYTQLQGNDFSKKDSLVAVIGKVQEGIEQIHFSHFRDIKNLCGTEQLADFNALAGELAMLFAPKGMDKNFHKKIDNQ